jgi:5-methylcytosine-specific restriction endonuclease McrA
MSDTLVLDMNWKPTGFMPWERAVKLYWEGRANIVKEDENGRMLRSASFEMGMPRVIQVKNAWTKKRRTSVPCSRRNIYVRDDGTCQYCSKKVSTSEFQIEHVVPRCQGGVTVWLNVVVACAKCNKKKAGMTPSQAKMPLLRAPFVPKVDDPKFNFKLHIHKLRPEWTDWAEWLYAEKASWLYWNVELDH